MFDLRVPTDPKWLKMVMGNLDAFLIDHAACERKASATALSFVVRYPNHIHLVEAMIDLAKEELDHFEQLALVIHKRGLQLGADVKDPYVNALLKQVRGPSQERLMDRLLTFGIIEGRGCERFMMVAQALQDESLKNMYSELAKSEARHHALFIHMVRTFFPETSWRKRMDELLDIEAKIITELPYRAALH
jgi:tRNA 2-(methylsulfanyl)-N6-isopentenyladenosine37 hydroxylase